MGSVTDDKQCDLDVGVSKVMNSMQFYSTDLSR